MSLQRTPSQTIGPYLAIAMPWPDGPFVVAEGTPSSFWIRGRVMDGHGDAVPDAMVETWQADEAGRFVTRDDDGAPSTSPGFRGFGRSPTNDAGEFGILTVKPGVVPFHDGRPQAPHLDVMIFARGLLKPLFTRIYFEDEAEANAVDPILAEIDRTARASLIAHREGDGYRFDIRLQGEGETTFFRT